MRKINSEIQRLKTNLDDLMNQFDDLDINEFEERLLNIQDEAKAFKQMALPNEISLFDGLFSKIKTIKKDNNFYEENSDKDRMFKNTTIKNLDDLLFDDDEIDDNDF